MNKFIPLLGRVVLLVLLLLGRNTYASEYVGLLMIKVDLSGTSAIDDYLGDTYIRGHAWLEFRYGINLEKRITVGTWGNNHPYGIKVNYKELEESSNAGRAVYLTREQFDTLVQKFRDYLDLKEDAWSTWNNCTYFATDVWNSVTGEGIDNRRRLWDDINASDVVQGMFGGPAPNPTSVYYSIFDWNGRELFNSWDWHSRQQVVW